MLSTSNFSFRIFSPILEQFQYLFELSNIQFELSNTWAPAVYFHCKEPLIIRCNDPCSSLRLETRYWEQK